MVILSKLFGELSLAIYLNHFGQAEGLDIDDVTRTVTRLAATCIAIIETTLPPT